jgi:hypothetical protein
MLGACLVLASACTKDDDDGNGGDDGGGGGGGGGSFTSNCGTVIDGQLQTAVSEDQGELVSVRPAGPNVVIIQRGAGELVRLHAVDAPEFEFEKRQAEQILDSLTAQPVWYFPVSDDCEITTPGGGQGTAGQFFTQSGINIGERLIQQGVARVLQFDRCGGELLRGCYNSLRDASDYVGGVIEDFIWKPFSDVDGNVVVAFSPFGTVKVGRESFDNDGSGAGRASVNRGSMTGCDYGVNILLDIRDETNHRLVDPDGNDIIVPNGCEEFQVNSQFEDPEQDF